MSELQKLSSVLVIPGVVGISPVDDTSISVVADCSNVLLDAVWASVLVGYAVVVSLSVVREACEVVVVVSGTVVEVTKDDDVAT